MRGEEWDRRGIRKADFCKEAITEKQAQLNSIINNNNNNNNNNGKNVELSLFPTN
jgi:hypothetical protein